MAKYFSVYRTNKRTLVSEFWASASTLLKAKKIAYQVPKQTYTTFITEGELRELRKRNPSDAQYRKWLKMHTIPIRGKYRKLATKKRLREDARLHPVRQRKNTPRMTRIYGKVLRIEAQKTGKHNCDAACVKAQHRYYHDFKVKPSMYGLPNGDLLIKK